MVNKSEKFWLDDPCALYKNGAYSKIIPLQQMTIAEQYNALTRLYLILLLIALLFDSKEKWWVIPFVLIIVTAVLYNINNYWNKEENINSIKKEAKDNETFSVIKNLDSSNISNSLMNGDDIRSLDFSDSMSLCSNDMNTIYSYDSIDTVASNSDNSIIGDGVINYDKDLLNNIEDQWEKKITERNFFTAQNTTVPTNQVEFAKWAYETPPTCKEDTTNCLRYEDLRYKR